MAMNTINYMEAQQNLAAILQRATTEIVGCNPVGCNPKKKININKKRCK